MTRPYTTGPRPDDVVATLQDGPLTTQEIAARLGVVDSTYMHKPLYQLEHEGRVVRQGHKMMARSPTARPGKRIVWALAKAASSQTDDTPHEVAAQDDPQ